jgi:glycosyltransferase involved in cell wall biosynthesis
MWGPMSNNKRVVIVVQQESLRERPRIHKLSKVLESAGIAFEVWKFRGPHTEESEVSFVRNLFTWRNRQRSPVLRYLVWMMKVLISAWRYRKSCCFFGVGFDSAFPIAVLPQGTQGYIFDNLDNISLSYRWPPLVQPIIQSLEYWVASRARIHVIPSRQRWHGATSNLRVVTNTPSGAVLMEAKAIAADRGYYRGSTLSVYINGWLSATRGIRTLVEAISIIEQARMPLKIIVAGRPASEDAERLIRMKCTENLGMLTNEEALATYYRSHVAFTYYDPSVTINRLAESQKWTDCWATGTPIICNSEVETILPYVQAGSCFIAPYSDAKALATLLKGMIEEPAMLERAERGFSGMAFKYWDDEMRDVIGQWLPDSKKP